MSNEPVHVALAIYDPSGTYSQHAGVVITSLFKKAGRPVIVHILHDKTLSDLNRERFLKTAEKYNQAVDFVDIEDYKNKLSADIIARVGEKWSIGSLYRLFMPEILPELDKIIYLDCDVIVNLDIAELWDIDIGENYLAGVREFILLNRSKTLHERLRMKFNNISYQEYINSGVLIMNLKKFRENGNLFNIVAEWLLRHIHSVSGVDQDALNGIFRGKIKFLEPKFNYFIYFHYKDKNIDLNDCIVHFAGGKPWLELKGSAAEELYWGTFFDTEWAAIDDKNDDKNRIRELIGILSKIAANQPRMHMHTKQCYKHIAHRLKIDILKPELFKVPLLIIQEFIAMVKYRN